VLATAGHWSTFAPPLLAAIALLRFGTRTRKRSRFAAGMGVASAVGGGGDDTRPLPPISSASTLHAVLGGRPGGLASLREPLIRPTSRHDSTTPGAGTSSQANGASPVMMIPRGASRGAHSPPRLQPTPVPRAVTWTSPARLTARSSSVADNYADCSDSVAGSARDHTGVDEGRDRPKKLSTPHSRSPTRSEVPPSSHAQLYHSLVIETDTQAGDGGDESPPEDGPALFFGFGRRERPMSRPTSRTGLADWLASGFGGMDFGASPRSPRSPSFSRAEGRPRRFFFGTDRDPDPPAGEGAQ